MTTTTHLVLNSGQGPNTAAEPTPAPQVCLALAGLPRDGRPTQAVRFANGIQSGFPAHSPYGDHRNGMSP
jgi:hypothetical protein